MVAWPCVAPNRASGGCMTPAREKDRLRVRRGACVSYNRAHACMYIHTRVPERHARALTGGGNSLHRKLLLCRANSARNSTQRRSLRLLPAIESLRNTKSTGPGHVRTGEFSPVTSNSAGRNDGILNISDI